MKKVLSTVVAALSVFSFVAIASAIPASDDTGKAISVIEGQDQGAKPVKKPVKKTKKAHKMKQKKGARKVAPTEAPASSQPSQRAPAAPATPAGK